MRIVLGLLAGGLLLAGCSCTDAGCSSEIRFGLDRELLADDLGAAYLFRMSVDGVVGSCSGEIGGQFACTNDWEVALSGQSDTAPPIDDSVPVELVLMGMGEIDEVGLTVVREGDTLLDEVYPAEAEPIAPNGRRCGPICEGFSRDVSW